MVRYVQQRNNADPSQVYVVGASSGAMMTNVLLGDYPDVFKAGAAFMGWRKVKKVRPPKRTIETTKSTVAALRHPGQAASDVRADQPALNPKT